MFTLEGEIRLSAIDFFARLVPNAHEVPQNLDSGSTVKRTPHNQKHADDDPSTIRGQADPQCRDALRGPMNKGIFVGPPHVS
jgi:hypothetical protein